MAPIGVQPLTLHLGVTMKNNRIARGQVSARRKDKALKVLDELLDSPADHVRQKAAAAALLASANSRGEDADPDVDPAAGRKVEVLPWNKRTMILDGKPVLPRFGLYDEAQRVVQIPPGFDVKDPQPEAHYQPYVALWWEAHEARMAAVRAKMANGIAPRPVIKLPNGEFEFADKLGGAGDFIWRQAKIKASALKVTEQAALPAPEAA